MMSDDDDRDLPCSRRPAERRAMNDLSKRLALRGRPLRVSLVAAGVLAALVLSLPLTLPHSLRTRLTAALGERFGGTVEMDALRVSIFPRLRVAGDAIVVRYKGRTDVPPLITIKSFTADANLLRLLGSKIRLRRVYLDRLEVNVPPGGVKLGKDRESEEDQTPADPAPSGSKPSAPEPAAPAASAPGEAGDRSPIVVDHILAERAVVRILRRKPGKPPREFAIGHLAMQDTGANIPWAFTAALTNPTPPGRIDVDGTFGPWNADTPAETPLDAAYEFSGADLGVFDGIKGILQSAGKFGGVLERIDVDGTTDVPDFALTHAEQPVHLQTTFHAIVDGTNGNTWLRPVEASFGETVIHTNGGVLEIEGRDGRTTKLDVVMEKARIEDVLRLAVKTKDGRPPMTGALKVKTSFELPPGHVPAIEKIRLDGSFEIDDARFGGDGVQSKVNELSQKARAEDGPAEAVVSDFTGRFRMADGTIRFSKITFAMPGARVDLTGTYGVVAKAIDFEGTVRLDAKISELTTGVKSFFLKLADPIFRRKNVTVIPITIGGTADDPKVGLDMVRAFTPK
jgi:hypothetical protein